MLLSNKLKTVLLKDLKSYKKNVQIHTEEQIKRIKKSIEENSYLQPICVNEDNQVIIGTGRYLALQLIDPKMEVEVVDLSGYSVEQLKKLRIVDNQLANMSAWDKDNLAFELKSIYNDLDSSFDSIIDDIGLEETLIDTMIRADENKGTTEPPAKPTDGANSKVQHTCPECGFVWTKK